MSSGKRLSPYFFVILGFAVTIFAGAAVLRLDVARLGGELSWLDALFTATSATCVTGLVVVDTGTTFSPLGQGVILGMIQVGGLGVMTYTSLMFYLWRKRISLSDRMAVSQSLLHDPSFSLASFLKRVVLGALLIEALGAVGLFLFDPVGFHPYSALFHSVSAFCNAGFALWPDSLMGYESNYGVNIVIMLLITLGGLGFAVLIELAERFSPLARLRRKQERTGRLKAKPRLSWHAHVVLTTSAWLVVGGAVCIYLAEYSLYQGVWSTGERVLSALFQSVTCRTAGFNTVDFAGLTNISLLVMILLMFIGGSPGSCAGGVKTTTFRALLAFTLSRIKGRGQAVVQRRFALDEGSMNDALLLIMYGFAIVGSATLMLSITEVGAMPHDQSRGMFLEILFECVSAFGTVGVTTGLTAKLTPYGKLIITVLMFVGRLGPIVFISVLHDLQRQEKFTWPEKRLPIG